jgi:hypothetical protein
LNAIHGIENVVPPLFGDEKGVDGGDAHENIYEINTVKTTYLMNL